MTKDDTKDKTELEKKLEEIQKLLNQAETEAVKKNSNSNHMCRCKDILLKTPILYVDFVGKQGIYSGIARRRKFLVIYVGRIMIQLAVL